MKGPGNPARVSWVHARHDPASEKGQGGVREGSGAKEERRVDVEDEGGAGGGAAESGREHVGVKLYVMLFVI